MSIFSQSPHGGDTFTLANACCYSWGPAQVGTTHVGMANIGNDAGHSLSRVDTLASRTSFGKRPQRDVLTGDGPGNQIPRLFKKAKGDTVVRGVLEAAGTTSRAPLKSATRTPDNVSDISDALGRGAGMLAAPSTHEVYHQPLPGPSVQKLTGTSALGEPSRIEGSGVEATQHHASDVEQQQMLHTNAMVGATEDEEAGRFRIPRLRTRHKNLLAATPEDLARGSVQELQCRLCPDTILSTWLDFKNHCDQTDGDLLKLLFFEHCREFFSRLASCKRHAKKRPPTCYGVSPEEAQAKRTATMQAHGAMLGVEEPGDQWGGLDALPATNCQNVPQGP